MPSTEKVTKYTSQRLIPRYCDCLGLRDFFSVRPSFDGAVRFRLEFFHPGAAAASARRKAMEKEGGREREQEGRELNYFVELEGEKVIDKVVPLHLAPSSLRRFAPARRGRSSVRFGATATLGAKRRKRRKDEARVIHASSPSPPDLVWVADNLESFG